MKILSASRPSVRKFGGIATLILAGSGTLPAQHPAPSTLVNTGYSDTRTADSCACQQAAHSSSKFPWTIRWRKPPKCCYPPTVAGAATRSILQAQIERANSAQHWLYHYDFYNSGPQLGQLTPRGKRQVEQFSSGLPGMMAQPVGIESTGDIVTDEIRRQAVLVYLSQPDANGTPLNTTLNIVIGYPTDSGQIGEEARLDAQTLMSANISSMGASAPTGTSPSSSASPTR